MLLENTNKTIFSEIEGRAYINCRVILLLSFLIIVSYSNSFTASFHLDDYHNITQNVKLQITDLYPETIQNVLLNSSEKGKIFYRPVSNLSIALNWYVNKDNVFGYHVVNTIFHVLTAFFLYLTIQGLFKSPNLTGWNNKDSFFIAVLAACLWAVNPIQTQAVTYIVQRMAVMAAMFSIIAIYLYICARITDSVTKRISFFSGVVFFFLLALGSKENAVMLPVSIFLLEIIFFQNVGDSENRKKMIWIGVSLVFIVFVLGLTLFLRGNFVESVLRGYDYRTFSLPERLMTQPRVMVFYLTQIFYPIADRLSIDHDFVVSTGLFSPWTTLPAMLFVFSLIGVAFWKMKKMPLFSFAILFFFVNHIVESSIIALEMVFEHRNYLPSFFLLVPVASGLKWVVNYYSANKKFMSGLVIGFVTILITTLGAGTYIRNMAWIDGKTLWEDAMKKAPGRARPYQMLAIEHFASIKDYDKVIELCNIAMSLEDNTLNKAKLVSLANMAEVYARRNDYEKAIQTYKKVLAYKPHFHSARYRLAQALIFTGQMKEATGHINQLLIKKPGSAEYLHSMAFILLKNNEPEKALPFLVKAIKRAPDNEIVRLSLGKIKNMMGQYEAAEQHYKRIFPGSDRTITALFLLIENSMQEGNNRKAENYAEQLVQATNAEYITNSMKGIKILDFQWPMSRDIIIPVISKVMMAQAVNVSATDRTNDG